MFSDYYHCSRMQNVISSSVTLYTSSRLYRHEDFCYCFRVGPELLFHFLFIFHLSAFLKQSKACSQIIARASSLLHSAQIWVFYFHCVIKSPHYVFLHLGKSGIKFLHNQSYFYAIYICGKRVIKYICEMRAYTISASLYMYNRKEVIKENVVFLLQIIYKPLIYSNRWEPQCFELLNKKREL